MSTIAHVPRFDGDIRKLGCEEEITEVIPEAELEDGIDPAEFLTELKTRAAIVNKLARDGNHTEDIDELKRSLEATITELERLLAGTEIDDMSASGAATV